MKLEKIIAVSTLTLAITLTFVLIASQRAQASWFDWLFNSEPLNVFPSSCTSDSSCRSGCSNNDQWYYCKMDVHKCVVDECQSCSHPSPFIRCSVSTPTTTACSCVGPCQNGQTLECNPVNGKCCTGGTTQTTQPNCINHYNYKCADNNLYWYDSCNNKQDLLEQCTYGCSDLVCNTPPTTTLPTPSTTQPQQCQSNFEIRCDSGSRYWFNSCGNREALLQACDYGCTGNSCNSEPASTTLPSVSTTLPQETTTLPTPTTTLPSCKTDTECKYKLETCFAICDSYGVCRTTVGLPKPPCSSSLWKSYPVCSYDNSSCSADTQFLAWLGDLINKILSFFTGGN